MYRRNCWGRKNTKNADVLPSTVKRLVIWLNSPVHEYSDWPPRWKVWDQRTGVFGGVVCGLAIGTAITAITFIVLYAI
jgi:tetrahydromethanopterin S-methyltransferase subunit B